MSEATLACEAVSRVVEDRSEVRETAPPILLRSDGAARWNGKKVKGTSGIGFAAWREGEEVMAFHAHLPDGSSSMVAEYWAAIAAMRWLLAEARADGRTLAATAVFDCETMVDQIRGGVAARSVGCAPLRKIAAGLVAELYRFGGFAFRHEVRESNCRADKLANIGASETEVTSSWPAWWTVEHTTAQVGTSLSADGSHGGWASFVCPSSRGGRQCGHGRRGSTTWTGRRARAARRRSCGCGDRRTGIGGRPRLAGFVWATRKRQLSGRGRAARSKGPH